MTTPMIARRTREAIEREWTGWHEEARRLPQGHARRIKLERRIDALTDEWLAADA